MIFQLISQCDALKLAALELHKHVVMSDTDTHMCEKYKLRKSASLYVQTYCYVRLIHIRDDLFNFLSRQLV